MPYSGAESSANATSDTRGLPQRGQLLPAFACPATDGRWYRLRDERQRHPVLLVLTHDADCLACRALRAALNAARSEFDALDVAVLIVMPPSRATEDAENVADACSLSAQPYPLLLDRDGAVARAYLPPGVSAGVAVYEADRYNVCVARWLADDATALPPMRDLLAVLVGAVQEDCACGLPAWPAAE